MGVGRNWREKAVSFPKIILRPHLKKEKPKAFGGRWGRISKSEGKEERRRQGVETAFLGGVGGSVGRGGRHIPSKGEGHFLPAWGSARTEPKTA